MQVSRTLLLLLFRKKVFSVKEKQQWEFEIKSGVVNLPPRLRLVFLIPKIKKNKPPT